MRHLLSLAHIQKLALFASGNVLLAFDFDGTLAPIVAHREHAKMRTRTAALFTTLCRLYPCAVISGRGRADVLARLGRAPVKYVVGNHGLEAGGSVAKYKRAMAEPRRVLHAALVDVPGVDIEDKKYSLSIHYRRSKQKRKTRQAILKAIAHLSTPMRVISGKQVFNLVPASAPHKGDALVELCARARLDMAVYVGDDMTDEDVFELAFPGRLLGIRIGRSASSAADTYLRSQRDVDVLLAQLVKLREMHLAR